MTDYRKAERTQTYPTLSIEDYRNYLIRLIKALTVAVLMLGLASCGGGSGSPSNTSPVTTITDLNPVGFVASATPQMLSINGTHFASGMTVSVTAKNGFSYNVSLPVVLSSTLITVNVTITAAPTDNFVYVTVIPTNSTPPATAVLGVAGTDTKLADVQAIIISKCGTCHDGLAATGYLDMSSIAALSSANVTGLIGIPSSNCSPKIRLVPGDPRRTSSVIIDKIQATIGQPACSGDPMPRGGPPLSATEIQTIIDWVAGGAN